MRVGTDGFDGSAFRRARCEQHNADHARFESTNHERNVPRDAVFWLGNHDIFSDDLTVFIGLFSVWCVETCNFMFLHVFAAKDAKTQRHQSALAEGCYVPKERNVPCLDRQ